MLNEAAQKFLPVWTGAVEMEREDDLGKICFVLDRSFELTMCSRVDPFAAKIMNPCQNTREDRLHNLGHPIACSPSNALRIH